MNRLALASSALLAALLFATSAFAEPCKSVQGTCFDNAEQSCSVASVRGHCPKGTAKVCCPAPGKITPKPGHEKTPKKP